MDSPFLPALPSFPLLIPNPIPRHSSLARLRLAEKPRDDCMHCTALCCTTPILHAWPCFSAGCWPAGPYCPVTDRLIGVRYTDTYSHALPTLLHPLSHYHKRQDETRQHNTTQHATTQQDEISSIATKTPREERSARRLKLSERKDISPNFKPRALPAAARQRPGHRHPPWSASDWMRSE